MARPLKKRTSAEIIRIVARIRRKNNQLWMSLMAMAVAAKPRKAKALIRRIVANDQEVSKWMGRI